MSIGLCERVKEQDTALLERTLPVLQQRLHKTGAALTDCGLVSERLQEWFVQRKGVGSLEFGVTENKLEWKTLMKYVNEQKQNYTQF